MYRIDNWINKGICWIIESIKYQYINISTFRPLIGGHYITLSVELRSPKKELINIKNNDQKCFLWCHVRHINPIKIHPERITQKDESLLMILIIMKLNFLCRKKILVKLRQKTTFTSIFFCYENKLTFPIYIS